MKKASKPRYYRALKQLWHTGREAAGENPHVAPGEVVTLDHLDTYQIQTLIDGGAVELLSADYTPAVEPEAEINHQEGAS